MVTHKVSRSKYRFFLINAIIHLVTMKKWEDFFIFEAEKLKFTGSITKKSFSFQHETLVSCSYKDTFWQYGRKISPAQARNPANSPYFWHSSTNNAKYGIFQVICKRRFYHYKSLPSFLSPRSWLVKRA